MKTQHIPFDYILKQEMYIIKTKLQKLKEERDILSELIRLKNVQYK
jgi:hypothetical protein